MTTLPNFTQIMAYENGELDETETIELFQDLIDSGLAWELQGSYGRQAKYMIDTGYCDPPVNDEVAWGRRYG